MAIDSTRCALRLLLCAAASLALHACQREPAPPPNVLLVSIDSLRADRLGTYGNPREVSPTIDRLAREGVLFERAFSPTSWTLPAHVTLLTGMLPHHHQTVAWRDKVRDGEVLLQEEFARRGYETIGLWSGPLLHPYYGFARGFDSYESCLSKEFDGNDDRMKGVVDSHSDRTNPAIEKHFADWVARRSGRPFFAFVHMWDVHYDYIAPEPYATMFTDPAYAGKLDGRKIIWDGFPDDASPSDVAHLIALYDGEIRYTDDTIGRMLAALENAGALSNTIVVITADHGEEFHEHGGKTHHRTVYTESVHVPLVVWDGRQEGVRATLPGHRVPEPVSLADVAPTIDDLAALGALRDVDGRSLAPALRGVSMPPRPVLSGMYLPRQEWRRMLAVREADRTLLVWKKNDRWVRFDFPADPGERRPVTITRDEERAPLAAFDADVMAMLTMHPDPPPGSPGAPPPPKVAAVPAKPGPAAPAAGGRAGEGKAEQAQTSAAPPAGPAAGGPPSDVEARLRSLGYVK